MLLVTLHAPSLRAQTAAAAPDDAVKIGDVTVSGWFRSRVEYWDWFKPAGGYNNQYAFSESIFRLAFSQAKKTWEWKLELAVPFLLGQPSGAVAPAPQGQLGFGGNYYLNNHNSNNSASIFAKQGYLKFKFGDAWKQSFLVGRTEFFDGAEVTPKNATLASLKRDRIAQRLIGNFFFADVGRSFDGGVYAADNGRNNVTLFAARPTRGVYQVDGWGEVNAEVYYGAYTRQLGSGENSSDLRVFGIGYHDGRTAVLKTDNRPAAARAADHGTISLGTVGAHYLGTLATDAGSVDALLWGVGQFGSWGSLTQRAYAYALEAGWQPKIVKPLKPWLRGGLNYGSGDDNPNDKTHGTFFQIMPTARQYARFPFFNMMNNRDAFGELVLRPSKAITLRSDVHALALANKNDLWYQAGGIYQPWSFGFVGRPSNGHNSFATLYDISIDDTINRHVAVGVYYAHAAGKLVIQSIYPPNGDANFGFLEFNYRF